MRRRFRTWSRGRGRTCRWRRGFGLRREAWRDARRRRRRKRRHWRRRALFFDPEPERRRNDAPGNWKLRRLRRLWLASGNRFGCWSGRLDDWFRRRRGRFFHRHRFGRRRWLDHRHWFGRWLRHVNRRLLHGCRWRNGRRLGRLHESRGRQRRRCRLHRLRFLRRRRTLFALGRWCLRENIAGRQLDAAFARETIDELARHDFLDGARRALHVDAHLLQQRGHFLAARVEQLGHLINPNSGQRLLAFAFAARGRQNLLRRFSADARHFRQLINARGGDGFKGTEPRFDELPNRLVADARERVRRRRFV